MRIGLTEFRFTWIFLDLQAWSLFRTHLLIGTCRQQDYPLSHYFSFFWCKMTPKDHDLLVLNRVSKSSHFQFRTGGSHLWRSSGTLPPKILTSTLSLGGTVITTVLEDSIQWLWWKIMWFILNVETKNVLKKY